VSLSWQGHVIEEKERPMTADTGISAVRAPAIWIPRTWTIDPTHTTVGFVVRHLMTQVHGTFSQVSGQITTGPDLSACSAAALISVSSVSTGHAVRDNHLRSPDFFDAERYPAMTFTSSALRPVAGSWMLSGKLTIREVTQPVNLEVEFLGTDPTGLHGEPRIGFSARTAISRRDFGITFGLAAGGAKIVVADRVDIVLDVQAFLSA
jgi:polyisoprenoid-binding protein YceI